MKASGQDRPRLGVLAASMAGNCVTGMVAVMLLGIVLVPISEEFGWPRAAITGVAAMVMPATIALPPFIGFLADRLGARVILLIGNAGFSASLALASFVPANIYVFYLVFASVVLFGHVTSPLLFGKILAGWFDGARGAALGLVAGVGNGVSTVLFPIVAALLLSQFGWRGAYFGTAAIVFAVGFPMMFCFLRDPPKGGVIEAREQETFSSDTDLTVCQALRTRTYWMLAVSMTLGSACMLSVLSHTVPALTDRGFALSQAVPVVSCISLVGMGTQMMVGASLDRMRRARFAAPLYASSLAGIYFILNGEDVAELLFGGVLLGVGVGTEFAVLPFLLSRYFGVGHYGKIAGVTYSSILAAGGLFPFLLDWSFDVTGTYDLGFRTMQVALAVGACLIFCLPAYRPAKTVGGEERRWVFVRPVRWPFVTRL